MKGVTMQNRALRLSFLFALAMQGPASPQSIESVIDMLSSREGKLQDLALPFTSVHDPAQSTIQPPFRKEGWWFRSGLRFGAAIIDLQAAPPTTAHAVWDGATLRTLHGVQDGIENVVIYSRVGFPFATYFPDWFGLNYWHQPWSSILASGTPEGTIVLGRESVMNRDCIKVFHAFSLPTPSTPRGGTAVVLWIDDGLAGAPRRVTSYVSAPEGASADHRLSMLDVDWHPDREWTCQEMAEICPGAWIAVTGRQVFLSKKGAPAVVTTVHEDGIIVNDHDAVSALLELPIRQWTAVIDRSTGREYAIGPRGAGTLLDLSFYQELRRDRIREGFDPIQEGEGRIPFELSSCGPNAVFHVVNVLGPSASLFDIIDLLTNEEIQGRVTSMARLGSLLEYHGLNVALVECSFNILGQFTRQPGCTAIVHFDAEASEALVQLGGQPTVFDHWAVAHVTDSDVELITPPHPRVTMKDNVFETLWDGNAILIAASPEGVAPFVARSSRVPVGVCTVAVAVGAACLLCLTKTGRRLAARPFKVRH